MTKKKKKFAPSSAITNTRKKKVDLPPQLDENLFLLNSYNADFVAGRATVWRDPRRKRLFSSDDVEKMYFFAYLAFWGLWIIIPYLTSFKAAYERGQLEEKGVLTIGLIKEISICGHDRYGGSQWCAEYQYMTDGQEWFTDTIKDYYELKDMYEGQEIDVSYVSDNPHISQLEVAPIEPDFEPNFSFFLAGLGSGAMLLYLGIRYSHILYTEMLAKGQLVDGVIIDSRRRWRGEICWADITYEFTSPITFQVIHHTQPTRKTIPRPYIKPPPVPSNGTSIKVLYLNDSRHQAM